MKFDDDGANVQQGDSTVQRDQGAARAISVSGDLLQSVDEKCSLIVALQSFIDPSLSWKDLPWFQSITKSEH